MSETVKMTVAENAEDDATASKVPYLEKGATWRRAAQPLRKA